MPGGKTDTRDFTGPAQNARWHLLTAEEALARLGTVAETGLDEASAARRLDASGPNRIERSRKRSWITLLFRQFADVMILVLVGAAVVSGLVGDLSDTIAILVILALNALIGFVQELRAERALEALQAIAAPAATVRRSGETRQIAADTLVSGDVVLLEAGGLVPADLRLLDSTELTVDEAPLTGESVPVDKDCGPLEQETMALGERANMAYRGTLVTRGRATGLVVATGMSTELGQIAHLLGEAARQATPLQKRLARFGRRLAVIVLVICGVILGTGLLRGGEPLLLLMTAVSLAVAAIPEALPAVVTIALALGARRMVRQQALIRRLPAVETLGSVTYICADKTGTLTQNRMRVERLYVSGKTVETPPPLADAADAWRELMLAMALNNDAVIDADSEHGDPTEVALLRSAMAAGIDKGDIGNSWPRVGELPFDAARKRMTTLHESPEGFVALVKGAPETVLSRCQSELRETVLGTAQAMASDGYRILAFARRTFGTEPAVTEALEEDLEFLGLVALMDPERPEAPAAVAEARTAGIRPVMITGDHPATALAMARRLGIADESDAVITARELESMDDEERAARVPETVVYARMSPKQKINIVRTLQRRGEFVAMTGDGVNDAPALKAADIGVAMGKKGTDVAREAADMVLLDDNFATIVSAIREGRRIYDNVRKFIRYTMTSNTGEVLSLFVAPFLGLPLPFLPIQILWINLVTDGLPGLALSFEKAERGVMRRPPRPPKEGIFARGLWQQVAWLGTLIAALTLATQAFAIAEGSPRWQTMAFTVLTFAQLANALAVRSESDSLFTVGLWSNRPLLAAVALTVGLQLAVIYLPPLQSVFHTQALTGKELALCIALPLLVIGATEAEKWLIRRRRLYRHGSAPPPIPG